MKSYNTRNSLGYVIRAIHCDECLCNKELYSNDSYSECKRQEHANGCFGGVPTKEVLKRLNEEEKLGLP